VVAVALLSVMILTFGEVISSADKMVTVGEASIRANETAAAISQVIKADFRRLSQTGFLCIAQTRATPALTQLFFTTAGPADSLTSVNGISPPSGDGSIVGYGMCPVTAGGTPSVLWRTAYLLDNSDKPPVGSSFPSTTDPTVNCLDCLPLCLADIQKMPRVAISSESLATTPVGITSLRSMDYYWLIYGAFQLGVTSSTGTKFAGNPAGQNQGLAPQNLPAIINVSQLPRSWQYLGQTCSAFSVAWTPDGVTWYGPGSPSPVGVRGGGGYPNPPTCPPTSAEFGASGAHGGTAAYWALWSHENQAIWPKAVKISFTNTNIASVPYEVMCLLGK
jgi:hypothetical protein